MSTDVGRTRSSVNSPPLSDESPVPPSDDTTPSDRHEHTTLTNPDRTTARPTNESNSSDPRRNDDPYDGPADGHRPRPADVFESESSTTREPDRRVQHRVRGRIVTTPYLTPLEQTKPSFERVRYARVADDDSLAPSRTRHPVVTSPMSAEAIDLHARSLLFSLPSRQVSANFCASTRRDAESVVST